MYLMVAKFQVGKAASSQSDSSGKQWVYMSKVWFVYSSCLFLLCDFGQVNHFEPYSISCEMKIIKLLNGYYEDRKI